MSKQVSAGGLVCTSDDGAAYVALVRKPSGTWVLPKGHREADETLEQTALREVAEETGLSISDLAIERYLGCWHFNEADPTQHAYKENHFFLIRYKPGGRPNLTTDPSHTGVAWQPWPVRHPARMEYPYQEQLLGELRLASI